MDQNFKEKLVALKLLFYKYVLWSIPSSDNIHWISSWLDCQEQCNSIPKYVRYTLFLHCHTQKQSTLHSENFSQSFPTLLGMSSFKWTKRFLFQYKTCISSQRVFLESMQARMCSTKLSTIKTRIQHIRLFLLLFIY